MMDDLTTFTTTTTYFVLLCYFILYCFLCSFFAGDALAAPTHWYYGGRHQVMQEYGGRPITGYTKPNTELRGSILNKSDLNGGGRSSSSRGTTGGGGNSWFGGSKEPQTTIIGDVINHGKQDLWSPKKQIHYHATLQKGENTLEVSIARVLMKSIVAQNGKFDAEAFRKDYIKFMTTPKSHNDTYASTCHRMFFSNLVHANLPPTECPDNDQHNVDVIDGLVLPTIAAMTQLLNNGDDPQAAGEAAAKCAAVTRKSEILEEVSKLWANVVVASIHGDDNDHDNNNSNNNIYSVALNEFSQSTLRRSPNPRANDALTACYLQQSLPGLVDMVAKYSSSSNNTNTDDDDDDGGTTIRVWDALLANANVGGENVHRGSVLGAILGARAGLTRIRTESPGLVDGLYHSGELAKEIDDFVRAVLPEPAASRNNNDDNNNDNNNDNNDKSEL
jgi:ADP-ribosyl-[dinitrogen reductase] hydrolase